jgi:nifR3 family TIM-barrel protein
LSYELFGKEGKIAALSFEAPVVLAPMAGITDASFRRLCREQGAALVYSEMVSAKGLWYNGEKSFELLKFNDEEKPIAFQIFGSEPQIMAAAARRLAACGNAVLDVNMGCPVSKVTSNGEGSALMKDVERAARIVEALRAAAGKPVSVKIRAGWDSRSVNAVEFARVLESAGADAIGVHARTREQQYSGRADWDIIARVKAAVRVPVLGSGDVMCAEDVPRMLKETGCDAVMVARGALGNPWIFRQTRLLLAGADAAELRGAQPDMAERARMFRRHALLTAEEKGAYTAVREMRKHVGWYFRGAPGAARLRGSVNELKTLEALLAELDQFVMHNS